MTLLDFRQRRVARALLLTAIVSPLTGPLAVFLLPFLTVAGLIRAKRWPVLGLLGGGITVSAGLALLGALESGSPSFLVQALSGAAVATFPMVCVSSPVWLALALWGEKRPRWQPALYALGLVLLGGALPALSVLLFGLSMGAALLFAAVIALALATWPLLKPLPPMPELLPLAEALELEADNQGWHAPGLRLTRRGQLTLSLPFSQAIPELYATKRGPNATRPLLGDAVLDNTVELELPEHLAYLAQQPALLLEAVHGAQANLSPQGIEMNRQLDKAAFREDPRGSREQVLRELAAVRALHAELEG